MDKLNKTKWYDAPVSFHTVMLVIFNLAWFNCLWMVFDNQITDWLIDLMLHQQIPSFWVMGELVLYVGLQFILAVFFIGLLTQHHRHHFIVWTSVFGLGWLLSNLAALLATRNLNWLQDSLAIITMLGLYYAKRLSKHTDD